MVGHHPKNKSLGPKGILKKKIKDDDTNDKYKAMLVAKDFKQQNGHDYFDTYLPVTRITMIWVLIALAIVYGLQMNLKTAFINGEMYEEI